MRPYQTAQLATRHRYSGHQLATKEKPMNTFLAELDLVYASMLRFSPAPEKPAKLTPEMIIRYAEKNFNHFLRMSRMYYDDEFASGIRIEEVRNYISIWRRVKATEGDWDKLDKLGKNEVCDAFYDEYGYED